MLSPNHLETLDLFIHVPKTGGTSLRSTVVDHYGAENVWIYRVVTDGLHSADTQMDVTDVEGETAKKREMGQLSVPHMRALIDAQRARSSSPEEVFGNAAAIIGHFSIDKYNYAELAKDRRVRAFTVVRQPLERMLSNYFYVRSGRDIHTLLRGWTEDQNPDLPFAEFALGKNVQNFQTRYTGEDDTKFTDIGTTGYLADFMKSLDLIEPWAEAPRVRKTARPSQDPPELDDPGFIRDFEAFHEKDYRFYAKALDRALRQPTLVDGA